MKNNQLILILLNIAVFFLGLISAFFLKMGFTPFSLGIHTSIDLVVLCIVFFVFSILFSGLGTPVIFLFYGLISSGLLESNPLGISVSIIPLLIASYAGSLTGFFSSEDLNERENLFEKKNLILKLFFLSLIIAVLTGFAIILLSGFDTSTLTALLPKKAPQ